MNELSIILLKQQVKNLFMKNQGYAHIYCVSGSLGWQQQTRLSCERRVYIHNWLAIPAEAESVRLNSFKSDLTLESLTLKFKDENLFESIRPSPYMYSNTCLQQELWQRSKLEAVQFRVPVSKNIRIQLHIAKKLEKYFKQFTLMNFNEPIHYLSI